MEHAYHLTTIVNAQITIQIDSVTAEERDLLKVPSQPAKLPIHLPRQWALKTQGEWVAA